MENSLHDAIAQKLASELFIKSYDFKPSKAQILLKRPLKLSMRSKITIFKKMNFASLNSLNVDFASELMSKIYSDILQISHDFNIQGKFKNYFAL